MKLVEAAAARRHGMENFMVGDPVCRDTTCAIG